MATQRQRRLAVSCLGLVLVVALLLALTKREGPAEGGETIREGVRWEGHRHDHYRAHSLEQAPFRTTTPGAARERKMEAYVSGRNEQCDGQGKWTTLDMKKEGIYVDYLYEPNMFAEMEGREKRALSLQTCEVETSENGSEGWLIHRIGPLIGVGGYDRHEVNIKPLPHPNKAKFITGKMMAPVLENGDIAGFPPIHTHHIMASFSGVVHAFESHGDAVCSKEHGGESCYLISYPEGKGVPFIANATDDVRDWMTLSFILNDVRRNDATNKPNPMVFYCEVAFKWSARGQVKPISAAALHMQGDYHPFAANVVTKRPSLRWNTGKWPVDGNVIVSPEDQMPWFHAHRSYFTAFWAFAASPEELGLTTDLLRRVDDNNATKNGPLDDRWDWVWTPKDPPRALFERVRGSEKGINSLRCWLSASDEEKVLEYVNGTSKSPDYRQAWQQDWKASWYDRSGEVHCKPWTFKKGDNYTVVALNGIDERYNWTHDQSDFFTMMQHDIFFLAYETTGPELGPTMEIFGDFESSGRNEVKVKWTYMPRALGDGFRKNFKDKNTQRAFEQALQTHLRTELDENIVIMRDQPPKSALTHKSL
ncbi:hypothetical protein HOP50_11g61720 [Chloropicon primus]|uniref:Uncharacterized protein n=2 Tax=Chloropicon primus TaxID=1764295 RepID=A0A5B8MVU5_9CHLO|nr:hypothetical protein A3770_11p61500 [Chloropicon primus]UPR02845.1 hypothetical protein HOP50_11g61720 [Chloropicon primus]|eukprot:QDZ23632.1 hypothetical protein A3770_11p61500 [Chloropicon primus]